MAYKLLYDITLQTLAVHKAGLYRVADRLLHCFSTNKDVELYPFIGTAKGNPEAYLKETGLPELISRLVSVPEAKYTAKTGIKSVYFKLLCNIKYRKSFQNFECFFSPFLPVPTIFHRSGIITAIMVHDLIPIFHPEFSNPRFIREYTGWMKGIREDFVFCNSNSTRNDFLKFRKDYAPEKVITTFLGVDDTFVPQASNADKKAGKYILGCSAASKRKNFSHLVDAFRMFIRKEHLDDVDLIIVGSPAENIKYELSGIENRVRFTGHIGDSELINLYGNALAFVYPSLYEGFGLPVLEAMKCGAPVICGNNSSLPEVGGEAALYISGSDAAETAAKLSLIYHNSDIRQEMQQKGFARVQNFSWKKCSNEIIREIINEDSH